MEVNYRKRKNSDNDTDTSDEGEIIIKPKSYRLKKFKPEDILSSPLRIQNHITDKSWKTFKNKFKRNQNYEKYYNPYSTYKISDNQSQIVSSSSSSSLSSDDNNNFYRPAYINIVKKRKPNELISPIPIPYTSPKHQKLFKKALKNEPNYIEMKQTNP